MNETRIPVTEPRATRYPFALAILRCARPRNRYLAGIEPTFSSKHLLDPSKDPRQSNGAGCREPAPYLATSANHRCLGQQSCLAGMLDRGRIGPPPLEPEIIANPSRRVVAAAQTAWDAWVHPA